MKNEAHSVDPSVLKNDSGKPLSGGMVLLKATLLALAMALVMLLITAIIIGLVGYQKIQIFLATAEITQKELQSYLQEGWNTTLPAEQQVTTILLLGVDTVANKSDAPPLTDTMVLIGINNETGIITTLSLPRDLWSEIYKTRINALYVYGQERYPNSPEQFPKEVIEEMTGIPIHFTVVISLDMLAELVDTLGGVTIDVPQSFTDTQFPRSDIDITTTTDPNQLYQTITFERGLELMSGERVLQYIRSRHSEGETGTDIDRIQRQQLVISSIAYSLQKKDTLLNPTTSGRLYRWYARNLKSSLAEPYLVAFGKTLFPHRNTLSVTSSTLSIFPDEQQGLIEHPPLRETDNQWVYTIRNPEAFRQNVYDMLISP